jgi:hypothetical protein
MNFKELLGSIPDYKEFMTISELDNSSRILAKKYNHVELKRIGESSEGRDIQCLKIGAGKKNALLIGFPHPNEPIGSMSVEFLSWFLAENPDFTKNTGYTWYLIKAIDVDGAILNEGWFKGDFDPIKYAKHYYRPASYEQVEWSFPIKYKKLEFTASPPETLALISLIDDIKPSFVYSLHNSGFGGVYYYITREVGSIFDELFNFVKQEHLPMHLGEAETPWMEKLHDGIFKQAGIRDLYDSMIAQGIENPQDVIKMGGSSMDYLKNHLDKTYFSLVCEIPYFYDECIEDTSLSDYSRREIRLNSLKYSENIYIHSKRVFRKIKRYCDKNSRVYKALENWMWRRGSEIKMDIHKTKTSSRYNGNATIAQAFDLNIAKKYYDLLYISMLPRLCQEAILNTPENEDEIKKIKIDFEKWVENEIMNLLKNVKFQVIPIQKLVRIQVGSAFITLKNLTIE